VASPDEIDALADGATIMADLEASSTSDSAAPSDAAEPRLFAGRYQLLRELGRGGMGVVYRARDTMVGDEVALKTLEIGAAPSPAAVERFRREVRLARRITHPNVARTHDLGDHDGQHYLTMEYIDGHDLAVVLARAGRLTPLKAASFALQICEGLAAAHAAGVVHRDLKPANIIIEVGGRVVLTDFGIARALASDTTARTVGTIGTPAYMAPEQVIGGEVDARADIYAVGLLLFEALTGRLPFEADSPIAAAIARLRGPAPDPRGLAEVPDLLAELLLRCLEREPADRPASAAELVESLRTWLSGHSPEATITPSSPPGLDPARQPASSRLTTTPLTAAATPRTTASPRATATTSGNHARRTQGLGARVAVLPFKVQGARDYDYLAEALAEAVIDVLGRTRRVEVVASSITHRFHDQRDASVVGQQLGVGFVVDATLQVGGERARAVVRLLDAEAGVQLWSGRFDTSLADPFAAQDLLGQQITEALRGELEIGVFRELASPQLIDTYRHARREVQRGFGASLTSAYSTLTEQLRAHPGFIPGHALIALIAVRAWFSASASPEIDWQKRATADLEEALRLAPDHPETTFASGIIAVQRGDWRAAAVALRETLAAAPTYPAAIQYLASLKCEAGRAEEGLPQLRVAMALDPDLPAGLFEYARCSALRGDYDGFAWAYKLLGGDRNRRGAVLLLGARVAAWRGAKDELTRLLEDAKQEEGPISDALVRYIRAALGEAVEVDANIEALLTHSHPRMTAMICQITAESCCLAGQPELALRYFMRAAESVLIDLEWCDHCPVLTELRKLPGFAEGRRLVRARVEAIWAA
jgi:serine/threonine protein kinase/tetratricopeptide (TPR) repeat protein